MGTKVEAGLPTRKLVYLIQISGLIQGGSGKRSEKMISFGYILM